MIEAPEAIVLARQLHEAAAGRRAVDVVTGGSPHRFAFFAPSSDGGADYGERLGGRILESADAVGPYVRVRFDGAVLLLRDGVNPRHHPPGAPPRAKQQLRIRFDDDSSLTCSVQMYGAMLAYPGDEADDDEYYRLALDRVGVFDAEFTLRYFVDLAGAAVEAKPTMSVKAFLATGQRIPGIGNGVLHDVLWHAGIHPKSRVARLGDHGLAELWGATVATLTDMEHRGGRDTETDLHGDPGGYPTVLGAKTWGRPCPRCGGPISRAAYLGGRIYWCPTCQPEAG